MGKARVGKLMQLFGESIDAMARAQELGQDPFAALDVEIGWDKLLGTRAEIAGFGELATSDPLSLAAERYAYMRKFAPAPLSPPCETVCAPGMSGSMAAVSIAGSTAISCPETMPKPLCGTLASRPIRRLGWLIAGPRWRNALTKWTTP